ncbi:LysR family transcriptional regulator [Desulfopila sp. IMCC35006]|uniref:TOBE domain-containing protein n=1 Tax=Desulfopila sp. IMCC35006 TaxID=2569542 RepID=UPI0010AB923B|nr:TOBE domain-containing protein [Desulfopila sp. IMCC35006]TKB25209.1 LysR family transcriptional regulator [Desulfopila sp. IMCC35006]
MAERVPESDDIIYQIMGWTAARPAVLLLQALERTGSINSAAQVLGIQYKSAWQKLDQINNLLPYPLVVKRAGGSGGGGSVLTEEGQKLLGRIDMLQKEFALFMQFFGENPREALETLKTLRRIEMKLSARNVWLGRVVGVEQGAVNSVINLQLKGGDKISSVITGSSVKRLELAPGKEVMAIVKASSVLLGSDIEPQKISARNILTGVISTIIPGAVNDEVTVDLPGGSTVTSIITSASVQRLGLAVGGEISAIIKASDVLLAIV